MRIRRQDRLSSPPPCRSATPLDADAFWALVTGDSLQAAAAEQLILEEWEDAHASILVELIRYESGGRRFGRWDTVDSAWDAGGGRWVVEEGALVEPDGERLERLPAHRAFWFGWYAQYPGTRLVRG